MASQFAFKIDGWTPQTIPQGRLGEYLAKIAKLYGEAESVHFRGLRKGSLVLVSDIEASVAPTVHRRLMELRQGDAPRTVIEAYQHLDDMLAEDNAVGQVRGMGDDRSVIISFPGRNRETSIEYSGIKEDGSLEGELIRIGGRDRTIHLALQSGAVVHSAIETDRETARGLGLYIFGPTIRLNGTGTWRRSREGAWILERFVVRAFDVMDDRPLADAIHDIRAIRGSEWHGEAEPVTILQAMRAGEAPDR